MPPRKPNQSKPIDPIAVIACALKACKCASDFHRVSSANTKADLEQAWQTLSEAEQQRITDLVNANTPADPKIIADELMACGTALELKRVKTEHGDVVKAAWKLLSQSERDRIKQLCAESKPEPQSQPEPQTRDSSEIPATYPENVVKVNAWLNKKGCSQPQPEPEPKPSLEPQPTLKKPTLIELTSDLQHLDDLLETIDLDNIPVELQTAVDELLEHKVATHSAVLEKLDNYAALIQNRAYWAVTRKAELERLSKLIESDQKAIDFLKGRLKAHLEATNQKKLRTKRFNISVRTAGGKQSLRLNLENPLDLPERFQRVIVEPDNTALREALEADDPEAKEVAYLAERTTYLAIN
jgi:hypothetical protein